MPESMQSFLYVCVPIYLSACLVVCFLCLLQKFSGKLKIFWDQMVPWSDIFSTPGCCCCYFFVIVVAIVIYMYVVNVVVLIV